MAHRWARPLTLVAAAGLLSLPVAGLAQATSESDVQANSPQVAADPKSDSTTVFPANKQNEPTIAVNPVNAGYLISGSNDEQQQPPCGPGPVRGPDVPASDCSFFPGVGTSGVYTSSDGGRTWTNRGLLDDQLGWKSSDWISDGDPVISYGPKPDGKGGFTYAHGARAYYATLASYKPGHSLYPPNKYPEAQAVSYSDDNGLTWSAPAISTVKDNPNDFNDKEWVTVDATPGSAFFGRVYVTWTEFRSAGGPPEPVMVTVSGDGGATFSSPRQLSPAADNTVHGRQGSQPTVGPDGTVYVVWEETGKQVVATSRDGGASWSRPVTAGAVADIQDPIPGANFRTDSFASIAADPRTGSTTVWLAWVNRTVDGGRVVVTHSSDHGSTWAPLTTVSTAAEGYAFFQGLDVAPNGRVDVGYQGQTAKDPSTYGTGNAAINAWYASSADGSSWTTPIRTSSASSDPAASAQNNLARQFWGDYSTLVSTNDRAWFIDTDSRGGVGCPAVDAYQHAVAGTALAQEDDKDVSGVAAPAPGDPVKPAPPVDCAKQFGNTDVYVNVITP
ncbi:sialidase family protein [Actinacidiphila oryziradicis]|uniref:exo-alpha-sialidase n=1 Tax=Actinacidiphila oryziradicis TaxID=2571141 RepID=A0A4U0S246_9ACTN|nr:sialidase family protein [Actinacidiphila oryziradicis]TKA02077.1 exo-alpha-sialidase [Actinacidiphila oryziradicis]